MKKATIIVLEESGRDAMGGRPMSLMAALRLTESELHGLKKRRARGAETTVPRLADVEEATLDVESIDVRIAELEKMLADMKEVIAWAEAKRPGASKNEDGGRLLAEYERETGRRI